MATEVDHSARVERAITVAGKGRDASGLRPGTKRLYARNFTSFQKWCRDTRRRPIPCTSETLAEYAAALLQQGYAKSTVAGRIAAVKAKHRERGETVPDGVPAWYVLRDHDPTTVSAARVNPPVIRREVLAAVARVCDPDTPAGARDLCLATLAWELLLGVSDLAAMNMSDVLVNRAGLRVRVRGEWAPVAHDHEPPLLCPVECAVRWIDVLSAAQDGPDGPLFRSVDKGGNIGGCGPKAGPKSPEGRLSKRGVQSMWRRLTVRAGVPPLPPGALRLGGAAEDVARGESLAVVLQRGRWSVTNATAALRLMTLAGKQEGEGGSG